MIQGIRYLDPLLDQMGRHWPHNRTVNIVCHGHSVPAGYFATPLVDPFNAYPHLLHRLVKERFPYAVVNVIVTAIGGENSVQGAERFERDVLSCNPDLITIDYSLNDRRIGLNAAREAWTSMIRAALEREKKVILCTPTWDNSFYEQDERWHSLIEHASQVRELADMHHVGLADSFAAWGRQIGQPSDLAQFLSHVNHPTAAGHRLVANEIGRYFIAR